MIKPGIYRHYRGGEYRIVCIAKGQFAHAPLDEADIVVYEALENNPMSRYWARPLAEFIEEVDFEGTNVPRFSFVREE